MKTEMLREIIDQVKDNVRIDEVSDYLNLSERYQLSKVGYSLQGNCPSGHASTGGRCFSINTEENYYQCFSCKEAGDVIELVKLTEGVNTIQALRTICDLFLPSIVPLLDSLIDDMTEDRKKMYQIASLYSEVFKDGKRLLSEPVAKPVLDYLVNDRGYDKALLAKTEFIYWDTETAIRSHLKKTFPALHAEIDDLSLNGAYGDNFRLAIPYRDRFGTILGFLKRAHSPMGISINSFPNVRWDSTKGLEKKDLFGLDKIKSQDRIILVEGYPDATYFPALGMTNIAAFGTAKMSEKFLPGLVAKNIKQIILSLDNDSVGIENTERICELFAQSDIQLFIVDPAILSPHKDADEYVKAIGIKAFKDITEAAKTSHEWYAKKMLQKGNILTDIGRSKAISTLFEYADSLLSPVACQTVLNILQLALSITPEIMNEEYERFKLENAGKRLSQEFSSIAKDTNKLIQNGEMEKAVQLISSKPAEALQRYNAKRFKIDMPFDQFLIAKKLRDGQRIQGTRLGYKMRTFSQFDRSLDGLQTGLYIIGAYPNVGKTAFMTSFCIDLLQSNLDAGVLFYTMDDGKETIVNRFLANLTDMEMNNLQFRLPPVEQGILDSAYATVHQWYKDNRFEIKETSEAISMDSIEHDIRLFQKHHKNLVVFIDGVYNVPTEGKFSSIREENIERANRIKSFTKLFNIPLIVTAELRKKMVDVKFTKTNVTTIPTMHDLMETGKYGYNADVVWLIYPQDEKRYQLQPEPVINIEFGKNKLSSFRETIPMTFVRAKSIIKPIPPIVSISGGGGI